MASSRLISRLKRIDWDFTGSASESAFSAIHWHPGRFVSQIPATVIGLLTEPGDMVLDPFVGSGTTVVEAQRLCRDAIGIDLSPVACLVSRAKTIAVSAKTIRSYLSAISKDAIACLDDQLDLYEDSRKQATIPPSIQMHKWYTREVRYDLAQLWGLFASYQGNKRTLADAAFSGILLSVCRETRHWGYVCDNTAPMTDHGGDITREICRLLDQLQRAYDARDAERIARLGTVGKVERVEVVCGDTLEALARIPQSSIDLVVTSPPYFGVTDYIKAQRLSMEWFEWDIEPLRQCEVGARSKRHRRSSYQDYVDDLAQIFRAIHICLRKGAHCAVILGESASRDSVFSDVVSALTTCGFTLTLDLNRKVSSQRRQAPSIKGEHLLILTV